MLEIGNWGTGRQLPAYPKKNFWKPRSMWEKLETQKDLKETRTCPNGQLMEIQDSLGCLEQQHTPLCREPDPYMTCW